MREYSESATEHKQRPDFKTGLEPLSLLSTLPPY